MSPTNVFFACGVALAAMSGAVANHWWAVFQLVASMEATPVHASPAAPAVMPVVPAVPAVVPPPAPSIPPEVPVPVPVMVAAPEPVADPAQKEFFEALLEEIRNLRGENRDLRDQMAETNRDVMKLEFRVDTHSASFRPLPVAEDRFETTFDNTFDPRLPSEFGVLPPLNLPALRFEDE